LGRRAVSVCPCIGLYPAWRKTRVAPAGSEAKEKLGSTSRPSGSGPLPTDMLAEKGQYHYSLRLNDIDSLASFSVENLRRTLREHPRRAEFSETSDFDSLAGLSNCANNPVIDPGRLLAAALVSNRESRKHPCGRVFRRAKNLSKFTHLLSRRRAWLNIWGRPARFVNGPRINLCKTLRFFPRHC